MKQPDTSKWTDAIELELKQLVGIGVLYTPVMLPELTTVIGTRLIFKKKRTTDGEIERYKARFVAQGFLQTFGVNFFDTYAPAARLTSFRIIYALWVMLNSS